MHRRTGGALTVLLAALTLSGCAALVFTGGLTEPLTHRARPAALDDYIAAPQGAVTPEVIYAPAPERPELLPPLPEPEPAAEEESPSLPMPEPPPQPPETPPQEDLTGTWTGTVDAAQAVMDAVAGESIGAWLTLDSLPVSVTVRLGQDGSFSARGEVSEETTAMVREAVIDAMDGYMLSKGVHFQRKSLASMVDLQFGPLMEKALSMLTAEGTYTAADGLLRFTAQGQSGWLQYTLDGDRLTVTETSFGIELGDIPLTRE